MTSINHALACIPETQLDPNGRYVAVQHWPDGVYLLSAADYAERKRDVHEAATFTAPWWRPEDAERLKPGQLYDRTQDITWTVAEWLAMRAGAAEAERKRVTLARVERDPVPDSPFAVDIIAVTEDGERHRVTVAWRTACQSGSTVADHVYEALEFGMHADDPPWLAAAYRAWSPESVRLGEARHAGEITTERYDAEAAALTRPWWRHHDAAWQGWTERAARDKKVRPAGSYATFPTTITRSGRGAF